LEDEVMYLSINISQGIAAFGKRFQLVSVEKTQRRDQQRRQAQRNGFSSQNCQNRQEQNQLHSCTEH